MNKPSIIFPVILCGWVFLLVASAAVAALGASLNGPLSSGHLSAGPSPAGGSGGPHVPSVSVAPGVILDVAPYGVEKWSPGLLVKVSVPVVEVLSLSVRPALLYENRSFALRAALTFDVRSRKRPVYLIPYFGGGLALYKDGSYRANPMISGGVDLGFPKRFIFMAGGNLLFETGDTDLELLGGIGITIH